MLCYDRQAVRAMINVYLFIEHVIGNGAAVLQIKHYVIHIDLVYMSIEQRKGVVVVLSTSYYLTMIRTSVCEWRVCSLKSIHFNMNMGSGDASIEIHFFLFISKTFELAFEVPCSLTTWTLQILHANQYVIIWM